MTLHEGVVLDLTGLETGSLAMAGRAMAHVQRCLSSGRSVVAVVSASAERSARDLAAANRLGATAEAHERAAVLASGPIDAAGHFAALLRDAGIPAVEAEPALWPVTRGHALDAEPRRVSAAAYGHALASGRVVVLAGGVGLGEDGRVTSLGANTASLSALFVGDRLALPVERPADGETDTPVDRGDVGGRKAARFAERSGAAAEPVGFASLRPARVATFGGGPVAGLVGAWSASLSSGLVYERFAADAAGAAAVRAWSPDVLVDFSGAASDSYDLATWALRAGKTVISTNTALLAERGPGLGVSALVGGGTLRASGAIRGCPALALVLERACGWPGVRRVQGSFSPLGDRVLDLRAQGMDAEEAERAAAAELGVREEDAVMARDGSDAISTLGAVAWLAFGAPAATRASVRGPAHVTDTDLARAKSQGRRYRVVATAERVGDRIALRVGPVPLREDDSLVCVDAGAVEAVVETGDGGTLRASGRLHHPGSVAAAVLRDLIVSRRDTAAGRRGVAGMSDAEPTLGATA